MFPSPQGTTTRVLPKHTVTFILGGWGAPASLRPRAAFLLLLLLSALRHGRPPAGRGAQPPAATGLPLRAPCLRGRPGEGEGRARGPVLPSRGSAAERRSGGRSHAAPLPAATCSAPAPARNGGGRGGGGAASRSGGAGRCSGAGAARTGQGERTVPAGERPRRPGLSTRRQHDPPEARSERREGMPGPSSRECGGLRRALPYRVPRLRTRGRTGRSGPAKSSALAPGRCTRGMNGHRWLLLLGALSAAAPPREREEEESKTLNRERPALLETPAFCCPSRCLGRATVPRQNQAVVVVLWVSVNATETRQSKNWCIAGNISINGTAEPSSTQSHQKSKGFRDITRIFSWISLRTMELHSSLDVQCGLTKYFFWVEMVKQFK